MTGRSRWTQVGDPSGFSPIAGQCWWDYSYGGDVASLPPSGTLTWWLVSLSTRRRCRGNPAAGHTRSVAVAASGKPKEVAETFMTDDRQIGVGKRCRRALAEPAQRGIGDGRGACRPSTAPAVVRRPSRCRSSPPTEPGRPTSPRGMRYAAPLLDCPFVEFADCRHDAAQSSLTSSGRL